MPDLHNARDASTRDDVLERIALRMTSSLNLEEVLSAITEGLIGDLGAAFARIWLIGPGDLCSDCYKVADCMDQERCLHLRASAGLYTNLNGEYRRVPLGALKIGRIAQGSGPIHTNDVLSDRRLPNKDWLKQNQLRSFAGYPLRFRDELLGVIAFFSRRLLSQRELDRLPIFANQAAIAIKNAQLFSELQRLKNRLLQENAYLQKEILLGYDFEEFVGESQSLRKVLRQVEQVAPTDATVLIQGETGTGKELIARAIHNRSRRRERALVKVNCAAISAGLVESELFGHEKGAFTGAHERRMGRFELADGGTIFLDEVGELPPETQVKILRVLQEKEFERVGSGKPIKTDARVIAATNRDLAEAVRAGSFRSDLFYRLNVFPLFLPPLRERKSDIPDLVTKFLARFGKKLGKPLEGISKSSLEKLMSYPWPGNVRELENLMERAAVVSDQPIVEIDDWLALPPVAPAEARGSRTLEQVEREHILQMLNETGWVIEGPKGAAVQLALHPNTLRSRMKKLGIEKPRLTG